MISQESFTLKKEGGKKLNYLSEFSCMFFSVLNKNNHA